MSKPVTALKVMKLLMSKQGFVIVGTTDIALYPIGKIINVLWRCFMAADYVVIGYTTKKCWQEQADTINVKWPKLIDAEKRNKTGYKFFMAVPVLDGPK